MILHNVTDRRNDWIGPWEVEDAAIDATQLTIGDEGRTVVYEDSAHRREAGTLSSWSGETVWVRFHKGVTAAACSPGDLRLAVRDASPDFYHPPTFALLAGIERKATQ